MIRKGLERDYREQFARYILIDATFRALWRDARKVDYLVDRDPFQALQWPRIPTARPDPFSEEERDDILAHFKAKVPSYFPFLHTLFWTGMRPSEALALRWEDIDLKHGFLSISKSRYLVSRIKGHRNTRAEALCDKAHVHLGGAVERRQYQVAG